MELGYTFGLIRIDMKRCFVLWSEGHCPCAEPTAARQHFVFFRPRALCLSLSPLYCTKYRATRLLACSIRCLACHSRPRTCKFTTIRDARPPTLRVITESEVLSLARNNKILVGSDVKVSLWGRLRTDW